MGSQLLKRKSELRVVTQKLDIVYLQEVTQLRAEMYNATESNLFLDIVYLQEVTLLRAEM